MHFAEVLSNGKTAFSLGLKDYLGLSVIGATTATLSGVVAGRAALGVIGVAIAPAITVPIVIAGISGGAIFHAYRFRQKKAEYQQAL